MAQKRVLAEKLRNDPELFARTQAEAVARLAAIPPMAKGVQARDGAALQKWAGLAAGIGVLGFLIRRRA